MEKEKGQLKIFFGYCAGVGKTYAMLQEAHQRHVAGTDVVIGYFEPHDRKETTDLSYGLESIATKKIEYKGRIFQEFDLDTALKRHPQLILVDELAHTNIFGCRHEKRYSDIEELLRAGIDVYTTVNVQHLESLHDIVEGITRIKVNERVPDLIFDHAHDVKLVDIEVDELIERLKIGKIYPMQRIQSALEHFFLADNLIALRSIALRRCAERVNLITPIQKRVFSKEHILVCMGTSPTNQKVIRTAARMAQAFHADFTALFVETEQHSDLNDVSQTKVQTQLQANLKLARHLGADIVSTYGNDVAYLISQYAKTSSVSKLVIGRSYQKSTGLVFFKKKTLVDQLTVLSPDLEVHIIPDAHSESQKQVINLNKYINFSLKDSLTTFCILILTTLLSLVLYHMQVNITNIILIFVLSACLIGITTRYPVYSVISAFYSVLAINFLFIHPRFTFTMYSSQYPMIFICMIVVSLTISFCTRKLKKENMLASLHAHSMDVLLETTKKLQCCKTINEVTEESSVQIYKMLKRLIIYYPVVKKQLVTPHLYFDSLSEQLKSAYTSPSELAVAKWVYENNKNAGVSTSTLPTAKCLYLAIRKNDNVYAVIGIAMNPHEELPLYERGLLMAMLNEIASALDSMIQQQRYNETILRSQWIDGIDHEEM